VLYGLTAALLGVNVKYGFIVRSGDCPSKQSSCDCTYVAVAGCEPRLNELFRTSLVTCSLVCAIPIREIGQRLFF
jgi:hypothetical protein